MMSGTSGFLNILNIALDERYKKTACSNKIYGINDMHNMKL